MHSSSPYIVVVVGFVDTLIEVNETDGQATLNVSIISPLPMPGVRGLGIMFALHVNSMDGSAGRDGIPQCCECVPLCTLITRLSIIDKLGRGVETSLVFITVLFLYFPCAASHSAIDTFRNPIPGVEDFPRIVDSTYYTIQEMPFDILEFSILNQMFNETRRSQTFTFPIFVDDVPEGVEELQVTLSLRADDQLLGGAVNVTPAVATVRIHDFSCKFIKLFGHGFSTNKALFKRTSAQLGMWKCSSIIR